MQALTLLREHLLDTLNISAENLITFVENGNVLTVPSANPDDNKDFQLSYQGIIYLLNVAIDARYICWVIGEWMNDYQPDRPQDENQIVFDADIKSHEDADLEFRINFKEIVCVKITGEGEETSININSCFPKVDETIPGVVIREH